MTRCCFNCDYFHLEDHGVGEMTEADWQAGFAEGECRISPPVLGPEIERDGDTFRCFGEFPKVLSNDWCGQFKPRAT